MQKFNSFLTYAMITISALLAVFACYLLIAGKIGESKIENYQIIVNQKLEQLQIKEIMGSKLLTNAEYVFLAEKNFSFPLVSVSYNCLDKEEIDKLPSAKAKSQANSTHNKCLSLSLSGDTIREKYMQELLDLDTKTKSIIDENEKKENSIRKITFLKNYNELDTDLLGFSFVISIITIVIAVSINAISFFRRKTKEEKIS